MSSLPVFYSLSHIFNEQVTFNFAPSSW